MLRPSYAGTHYLGSWVDPTTGRPALSFLTVLTAAELGIKETLTEASTEEFV
jgi:hypothetical protein